MLGRNAVMVDGGTVLQESLFGLLGKPRPGDRSERLHLKTFRDIRQRLVCRHTLLQIEPGDEEFNEEEAPDEPHASQCQDLLRFTKLIRKIHPFDLGGLRLRNSHHCGQRECQRGDDGVSFQRSAFACVSNRQRPYSGTPEEGGQQASPAVVP